MIATAKQIETAEPLVCYSADYENGYTDGVEDGLRASGITDGDAFFEIGLTLFAFVCGMFAGWVWVQL